MIPLLSIALCLLSLAVCGLAWWLRAMRRALAAAMSDAHARIEYLEELTGACKREDRE